jgi:uncharacterized membrane protein
METHNMRDNTIDRLRGLSILIMFYAHLIPHYSDNGTTLFFFERVVSSVAAPMFLFLVGYNFKATQSFTRIGKRIFIILVFAASIDLLVWKIYPFYSFDVLYLIGFSLLFLYILKNLDNLWKWFIFSLLLLSPVIISLFFLYSNQLDEPYLNQEYFIHSVLYNFFINGWFPFFPWVLFPLLGYLFQKKNLNNIRFKIATFFPFLVTACCLSFFIFPTRVFAVEIFYPADIMYLLFALSYVLFLCTNRDIFDSKPFYFLSVLGKTSFFLYAFHLTIYNYTADFAIEIIPNRFLCFILYSILFWFASYVINENKQNWKVYSKYDFLQVILGR